MSVYGEIFDITIIGAGPVGLYGALYAGSRGLRVKIIESGAQAGGRLITHYPEKIIYDVAGHPEIKARVLIDRLLEQVKRHKPEIFVNQRVTGISRGENGVISLHTPAGEHRSRTVVISAGVGAFLPEKLELPGTPDGEANGIHYSIERKDKFSGKRVVVVGTGDNALEWAVSLRSIASEVTLVHRLNRLGAPDDVEQMLRESGVSLKFPFWELKEIHGTGRLQAVTIVDSSSGAEEQIECDALVLNIGSIVNLNDFKSWGLTVGINSIAADEKMATNIPGVYAAGDIVTHAGKIKLISTGAGEAAVAIASAAEWIASRARDSRRAEAGAAPVLADGAHFYSGYEAVQMAILLERQALQFFQTAFRRATGDSSRDLFARMQRQSLDMIDRLQQEVLPAVDAGKYAHEDLDDTAAAYLQSMTGKHLFGGLDLAKEALKNSGSDLQNIYTGIRIEEDLKLFFERLGKEANLVTAREPFNRLTAEKRQTIEQLRAAQARIMDAGVVD